MSNREAIVEAITTYCRAETEGDKDAFMALFADKVLHEDPVGYAIRYDRAGLEELWAMAQAGNVELWLERDVIVAGDEAIAIMRCRTGPEGGRREMGPIVDHFVFDEAGKITSVRAFYDIP
jgi:steroid Delta-isomerase